MWILERRFAERWSLKQQHELSGPDGDSVSIPASVSVTSRSMKKALPSVLAASRHPSSVDLELDFRPTRTQALALTSPARELLYSGASGGGKSWLLRVAASFGVFRFRA
jgi:hypothetical protein